MSSRRPTTRVARLEPEVLEDRRLLSKTLNGVDLFGNHWSLTLTGPGDFRVINQPDSSGTPVPLGEPAEINSINIAGADPLSTRLVGKVTPAAGTDGRVFFQSLTEQGGRSEGPLATNGIYAIDMPGFYLGRTATTTPATTSLADQINIPDGVITLRFGGVDTTFTPPGGTALNTNNTADPFLVNLGIPRTQGTSIIVNTVTTSGQAASGTGSTAQAATQDSVTFDVDGRINVFQANEIDGDTAVPTSSFRSDSNFGGTLVVSTEDPATTISGQIGFIRVGGNATNFGVQVGGAGVSTSYISNFYVGGETNNVTALAVNGLRNAYFGKGLDNSTIYSHNLISLHVNRDVTNSNVYSERAVGNVTIGGDVSGSKFQSGYSLSLPTTFSGQTTPTSLNQAQDGGSFTQVLVAGNFTNSLFAASEQPGPDGTFGSINDLKLPHGRITGKIEGTVDNSTLTPDAATTPFFAKSITVYKGPVVPPSVPELPLPYPRKAPSGHRIVPDLQPVGPKATAAKKSTTTSVEATVGHATPKVSKVSKSTKA